MTYNIRSFPSRHWLAALLCAAAAASLVNMRPLRFQDHFCTGPDSRLP